MNLSVERLAAANNKLAYLQRAVKFRGIPAGNVLPLHCSFASQHRQRSRAALVTLARKTPHRRIVVHCTSHITSWHVIWIPKG